MLKAEPLKDPKVYQQEVAEFLKRLSNMPKVMRKRSFAENLKME